MVFRRLARRLVPALLGLALLAPQAQGQPVLVDLELSLLIDVSGSVSPSEFLLQRTGYVNAFKSAAIHAAIASGFYGAIAVNVVYWAASSVQAVGWHLITNAASANIFANALAAAARPGTPGGGPSVGGGTRMGQAINFGVGTFAGNGFAGTRHVIDVSGDGTSDVSLTQAARNAAVAAGFTINGIAIGGGASLLAFYQNSVIGGPGAFAIQAADFAAFGGAIDDKLIKEIQDPTVVPEPATMVLMATGLLGLGAAQWRRRRQSA